MGYGSVLGCGGGGGGGTDGAGSVPVSRSQRDDTADEQVVSCSLWNVTNVNGMGWSYSTEETGYGCLAY